MDAIGNRHVTLYHPPHPIAHSQLYYPIFTERESSSGPLTAGYIGPNGARKRPMLNETVAAGY